MTKPTARTNRMGQLARHGFMRAGESGDFHETGWKMLTSLQGQFDLLPQSTNPRKRKTPQYVQGYHPGFSCYFTIVFDPLSSEVWASRTNLTLSKPPFCFRNVTALAREHGLMFLKVREQHLLSEK